MPGTAVMYMGTQGYEQWVPACAISPDFSRKNLSQSGQFLSGGSWVIASKYGARAYQMTWGPSFTRDQMRAITDYAEGLFDTQNGINLIYFLDPMTVDKNVLPPNFAAPGLTGEDAPGLFGPDNSPSVQQTAANSFGYPARTAVYHCDRPSISQYIPIPPGYTAWVGAMGNATGAAGVRVTQMNGTATGSTQMLTLMGLSTTLVNTAIPAGSGVTGISIDFPETGKLRNLAPNPSFESDVVGVNAVAGTGGVTGVPTRTAATGSPNGSWVSRVTWTTGTTALSGGQNETVPVSPGLVYSFSGYVRTSIAQVLAPVVDWYDAGGNLLSTTTGAANVTTTAAQAWNTAPLGKVESAQAPSTATTARFGFRVTTGGANWTTASWIEIDAIQANQGSTVQTYADGNTAGWQWMGTVNDSISRQAPDTLTLTGMVCQVLPTGRAPLASNFISGQGNGGCQFAAFPTVTPYNRALDLVGATATLLETGPWLGL